LSLINQMLKDLEKRSSKGAVSGVGHLSRPVLGTPRGNRALVVIGLFLVLTAGIGVVWFLKSDSAPPEVIIADGVSTAASPPIDEGIAEAALPVSASGLETAPTETLPVSALLENLRISRQIDGLQVEMSFSHVPAYRLMLGEGGTQLTLELPDGTMVASLPNISALPLLQKVSSESGGGAARLLFTFNEACRYEELSLSENRLGAGRVLRFVVQPAAEATPVAEVAAGPLSKSSEQPTLERNDPPVEQALVRREIQPTAGQRAENYCREGIRALQQGRWREGEAALRTALAIDPRNVEARDVLLGVLSRQNRPVDVKTLLAEGVRSVPENLSYRIRYARLLLEEGALSLAREQLTREPVLPVAEAVDLYAMLATVLQRQGDFAEAARTYQALLTVKPRQAVWWMGLGIALEGSSSEGEARQAYRQALTHGELSGGLQAYIRQRLAVLDKQGSQATAEMTADKGLL